MLQKVMGTLLLRKCLNEKGFKGVGVVDYVVPNAIHSTVGFSLKRVDGLFDCMYSSLTLILGRNSTLPLFFCFICSW